ncbi:MAG: nucleotidyltransferase [Acidobacteriaceae bacterium]|nr:nucleotidyltransferase [Acidobacteriaceae bacterium]
MPEERPTSSQPVPVTSSIPPDLPREQEALFREVLRLLTEKRVPFAVSGAFALRQHTGIFRDTKDLDLFLTAENAPRALSYLEQNGFHTELCDPVWLMKAHRDEFFVDLITGMSNAAIVVDDSWILRAHPAMVYGVETRVLAPEELIASKLFVTRRERFDGADIVHVIYGMQGKLDWDRILEIAGEHWEMLLWALILFRYVYPAKTDYVPKAVWEDLLGRFQILISQPDPNARFRGSLVDENMFAIDLREWGLENVLEGYRKQRLAKIEAERLKKCG